MSYVVLACVLLGGACAAALLARRALLAAVLAGLFLGPLAYGWLGMHLARRRGIGRFFSVPFGGDEVGEQAIFLSAAVWIAATGLVAYLLARLLRRRPG